jgi:hypothetical protein
MFLDIARRKFRKTSAAQRYGAELQMSGVLSKRYEISRVDFCSGGQIRR